MKHLNYFSEKEKKHIHKFKRRKSLFVRPLAKALVKIGITANMISLFGFLMIFGFVYFLEQNKLAAAVFLLLHVLIDGIDGPVAKIAGKAGNKGAFVDIMCDHTGIIIATAGLAYYGLVNGAVGIVYTYLYTMMIIYTIIRNVLSASPKMVIRTKYYIYLLYGVYAVWGINYFNQAMIIFSALMLPSVFSGFASIRKKLD